jgi:hypothetical protein
MTISATNATSGPFVPNDVTTAFPFTFAVGSASELRVLLDGTVVSSSLYTVTLNSPSAAIHEGGTVTFTVAPTGAELLIESNPDFDQDIAFTNSGPFLAESHDEANDRAAIRDIYLRQFVLDTLASAISITGVADALTRSAIKSIPAPTAGQSMFLGEPGATGFFVWRLGDFSANVISDPDGLDYLVSDTIPDTIGAWVREPFNAQQPLSPPAGFDWYPPVKVYLLSTGAYTTNFNAEVWKVPATASIYVSRTGNNTTGNGTVGNPYLDLWKAFAVADTLPDAGVNIYAAAGEYTLSGGTLPDKDINLIPTGGRLLLTGKITRGAWTLDGAGTYKTPLSGYNVAGGVRDAAFPVTWPNGETTPQRLALAASKAACQATPSTYFTDGTDVWVHLQDGRLPVDTVGSAVGVIHNSTAGALVIIKPNRKYYFEKIDIEGSGFSSQVNPGESISRIVANDCRVWHSIDRTFSWQACPVTINNNCRVFDADIDAFAYSPISTGQPQCKAVEIDCRAYKIGKTGNTNNGSTNHDEGHTVRVNCIYRDTLGPICADVFKTKNWNLGVDAQNSLLATNDQYDSCFVCGDSGGGTAQTWLDGCISGGSFFDAYVGPGCALHYRNMAAPASVGGTGTVGTY